MKEMSSEMILKKKMITPGELNVNNQKYVFVMNTKRNVD